MKKIFVSLIVLISVAGSLFAEGGIDFSGNVQTLWGVSTPWTSKVSWNDSDIAGNLSVGDTSISGTLDAYYDKSSAFAEGSLSYDATANSFDWSLDELWLDYTDSFWGVRIGRQKTAWGKADGIDITNVICPTDMSSFSAMISDDNRLAIDSIRFSITGNQFMADAYWIPFFTPSKLPLDAGNQLRKHLVPETVDFSDTDSDEEYSLPVVINSFQNPELKIQNGEYALKLSGYFPFFDLSLYGFYGWEDTPILDYSITFEKGKLPFPTEPSEIVIDGEYKRMGMIGLDAAIPIKEVVVRLEGAFFPDRYFQKSSEKIAEEKVEAYKDCITKKIEALMKGESTDDFEPAAVSVSEQKNQVSGLIGLDWMPDGWTITAQYYFDYVFGNIENLDREKAYQHGLTLNVSKAVLDEKLNLGISGVLGLNDFDCFISPTINYSLSDQIKITTAAYIFLPGPERDGEYGKYKDLSCVVIGGKYSF